MGWLTPDGFFPARCGAPNRCAYCAYLSTIENALVVKMDAGEGNPPTVGLTLTTQKRFTPPAEFREDVDHVFRWLRRRLGPDLGYLGMVEFTTGLGERSDGYRRIHQHLLLKRVDWDLVAGSTRPPESFFQALERELSVFWHSRTGADRVELRELRRPAGAVAYLIHHHRKSEQKPPAGWTGKRLRPSKNYYDVPVAVLRAEARAIARDDRLRAAADAIIGERFEGVPDELLCDEFDAALADARAAAKAVLFVRLDRRGYVVPESVLPADAEARAARTGMHDLARVRGRLSLEQAQDWLALRDRLS